MKENNGTGYEIGAAGGAVIGGVLVAAGADINIIPDVDNDKIYRGGTISLGLGTPGFDFHIAKGNTTTIPGSRFNIFDIF